MPENWETITIRQDVKVELRREMGRLQAERPDQSWGFTQVVRDLLASRERERAEAGQMTP